MKKRTLASLMSLLMLLPLLVSCSNVNDTAMSLGKQTISRGMYNFWLSDSKYLFVSNYSQNGDSDEFWSQEVSSDGQSAADFVTDYTENRVKNYLVALTIFDELGLTLPDSTLTAIDEDIAEKEEYHGGKSVLNEALSKFGINSDILRDIYIIEQKYKKVSEYLYGDGGTEAVTDDELNQYYQNNYIRFKYILIYTGSTPVLNESGGYTYDGSGNIATRVLDDTERAQKLAKVDSIKASLSAGGDFEELMGANTEKSMTDSFPNGITVNPEDYDTFGADFILALMEIEPGGFTSVTDDSVTYILKRYDLTALTSMTEDELGQISDIGNYCKRKKMNEKFSSYYGDIEINEEITGSFDIREVSQNSYF